MQPSQKIHVYAIVGPTGVGKTSLSIKLAKKIGGEVLSADSRQVYTHLTIGTEKISKRAMKGVRHHLMDVRHPRNVYTVANFKHDGTKAIDEIVARGAHPIIVGGTGWYVDALLRGVVLPDVPPNPILRKQLETRSVAQQFALLKKLDPVRASSIDPNNSRRLVRAIEIAKHLGKVPTAPAVAPYSVTWLGILPPAQYEQDLVKRLRKQLRAGLLKEIQMLLAMRITKKRINELGLEYRTGLRYLNGDISKKEMESVMTQELRQLGKRQMTWFKKNPEISWKSYEEHCADIEGM